jgi:uncharacterized protein YbjT (DUF2867 family)
MAIFTQRLYKQYSIMTTPNTKQALIAGATGLVGSHLLQQLLNNPGYSKIHLAGRRAPNISDPKIIFHPCDFDDFDSLPGSDIQEVFCALGTTIKKAGTKEKFRDVDFDAVVNLARWAALIGCNHFVVVSSLGANPRSRNFYLRTKGQMEQVLKNCHLQNLSIVRPSLLMGKRNDFRLAEKMGEWFMKPLGFMLKGKLAKYRPIEAQQLAQAMINLAQNRIGDTFIVEGDGLR